MANQGRYHIAEPVAQKSGDQAIEIALSRSQCRTLRHHMASGRSVCDVVWRVLSAVLQPETRGPNDRLLPRLDKHRLAGDHVRDIPAMASAVERRVGEFAAFAPRRDNGVARLSCVQ